jgi:hypothetical protein
MRLQSSHARGRNHSRRDIKSPVMVYVNREDRAEYSQGLSGELRSFGTSGGGGAETELYDFSSRFS